MKAFLSKYLKSIVAPIVFVSIFLILFSYVQDIFELKGACYGKYKYYNQEDDDSIDVIYFGNSRTNRGINPLVVDEIAGCYSYNLGIQGLRANHVYYRLLDAFKTQSPKLVVLETSMYMPSKEKNEESYIQRTLMSLPFSPFKVKAAMELGSDDATRAELIMPLLRFHNRFREIESVDFLYIMDLHPDIPYDLQSSEEIMANSRGYMPYTTDNILEDDGKGYFDKDYASITDVTVPDPGADYYFQEMIRISEEHGAKVLIISIPSMEKNETAKDTVPIMNYLKEVYKDDPNVGYLDICTNMKEIGLDYNNFHNKGHLNRSGAQKISEFIGEYLRENYDF